MRTIKTWVGHPIPPDVIVDLPFCWVCRKRFIECGGRDPTVMKHVHHVVPQAAGGTDGPTVTLCTHHHDVLHRIAEAWMSQKDLNRLEGSGLALLRALPASEQVLIQYLSRVCALALHSVRDDPFKKKTASFSANAAEIKMLRQLQKLYGTHSRDETLRRAVQDAYRLRFPIQ